MNFVKQFVVLLVIIIFSLSVNIKDTFATSADLSDVDLFIDQLIQDYMEENHVPNATISIVSDGEVIFEKGYGHANIEEEIRVDPEKSLFRIGSTSKLVTWTAVMQLMEQGKLDLDTDVNEYIDFEIPEQLLNNQNNSNPKPITLRHLMTHTPGFEDYSNEIFRLNEDEMAPLHEYVREYLPKRIFPAGEVTAYSNYGTALAGYIVEHVSGVTFSEYVEQHIFKPLHMTQSTFEQPLPSHLSSDMTQAYRYVDDEFKKGAFEFVPGPAGGMSSTASDMAQFMKAYLNEGRIGDQQLLHADTIKKMFTRQSTQNPALDGMGLGFIEKKINEKRVVFHGGSTMLFDSGLYLLPEEDVGIFIAYSGADHLFHLNILEQFMNENFPVEKQAEPLLSDGAKERSKQFVGEYHENRKSLTTDDKFISLMMGIIRVDVDNDGYLEVTHLEKTNRFAEIEPGIYQNISKDRIPDAYGDFQTISFDTDPNGEMMLTSDGPMSYSKAPWYGGTAFTFSSLILSLLLIIGTMIFWTVAALIRTIRKKAKQDKFLVTAKWTVIGFGLLMIALIGAIVVSGEIDPVYPLPKDAYGQVPAWFQITDWIFLAMMIIGPLIILFTIVAWVRNSWKLQTKILFSLLSSAIVFFAWIFSYWNLF